MSEKVTAMIEEIKGLTVLELSELVHALEEEFGVSAAAMAAPAAGAAAPAAEEKTSFDVVLAGFDAAAKIKVIKVVREITGQGLAEAKATVEGAPKTLKEGCAYDWDAESETLKRRPRERASAPAIGIGKRRWLKKLLRGSSSPSGTGPRGRRSRALPAGPRPPGSAPGAYPRR